MTDNEIGSLREDPEALERFYREHLPAVRAFVARRVNDPAAAADLTADIFVRIIESAASYREDRGTPRAWVIGIARHVLADHWRRLQREDGAIGRLNGRRLLDEDSAERIAERIAAEGPARDLLRLIAALPDGQRDIIELVAVEGLSFGDAGRLLQINAGTARVRYHRARRALRSQTHPFPAIVNPEVTA